MMHRETPETYNQGTGKRKGKANRGNVPDVISGKNQQSGLERGVGGKQRKQSGWSGGLVEEKMHSVVTVVPPQEMRRLMALARQKTPANTPALDSAPVSPQTGPSSVGQPSPTAPPSVSSEAASSLHSGTAISSPVSPAQSPLGPRSCSTASVSYTHLTLPTRLSV